MGEVIVAAKIENIEDLYEVDRGNLTPEQVRCVEVSEALVDTGATMLSLPANLIVSLGLKRFRTRCARTTTGLADFGQEKVSGVVLIKDSRPPFSCMANWAMLGEKRS